MDRTLFITTDLEREWLAKFEDNSDWIRGSARETDIEGRLNHRLIDWLLDHGYNKLTLPEARGGFGCDIKSLIAVQEALASYDEATALSIGWHLGVVGEVFEFNLWSDLMLDEFAEAIHAGAVVNRVVSEAETGSPTRGGRPSTYAVRKNNGWLLNGVKTYVSMSHRLTHYIVGAFVEEMEGLAFFYVPVDTDGCRIEETWNVMGMRATESHDLIMEDVFIPDHYLVEDARHGLPNPWLMHIPAVYLGTAQHAYSLSIDFAKTYSPNSIEGTISELAHIESRIGEMTLKLMTARHFLYHAAELHLTGHDDVPSYSAAKTIVMNEGLNVIDSAMRIIGAKSLDKESDIERLYRSMRAGLHNPPMEDAVIRLLAKTALN